MTKKELEQLIEQGEGYYTEFKESLNTDFKKELVAFANASGGKILLGVDDKGKIKGINPGNKLRSEVQQHANDCDPPIHINMQEIEKVMIIDVDEGQEKPYRSTNGFFLRVGPNSQKMSTSQIADYVEKYGRVRFDERIRKDVRLSGSVNDKLIDQFINQADIKNVFHSTTHILQSLGVVKEVGGVNYLTNAGILFFTTDPALLIPQAKITCVAYNGTDKVAILDRKDFSADIITSIDSGLSFLRRHLNEASDISKIKREEKLEIPLIALREALVNAVAHRDYLIVGARIMIEIFSDRVIISNPGGLPPGLSEKDFGKYSLSRNPVIADLLLRVGLIEKLGSGVNRIRDLLNEAGLPPAEFHFNNFFSVNFKRKISKKKKTESAAVAGHKSTQENEPKGGQKGGQESGQKGGQESSQESAQKIASKTDVPVTQAQGHVLALIYLNPQMGRAEMARQLKINESAVQKHLENLRKKGVIERVGPAKGGYWKINVKKNK